LCPPALTRLFRSLGVTVLSSDQNHDLRCDYYCPSSALPLGFDLTPESLPNRPYLTANPRSSGARVGLMPDASKPDRSLPAEIAEGLLRDLGALDLRPSNTGAQDLQDTAELVAGLDLVITVDTAVAHLAGAMGRPTWVLLPEPCDWRWMVGRADTPWYPSATLFRGSWPEVAAQVRFRHQVTPGGT
ncbi:glycosyltransferase family 9 protein, partial [Phenylobacterium sp. CCH9-H3]